MSPKSSKQLRKKTKRSNPVVIPVGPVSIVRYIMVIVLIVFMVRTQMGSPLSNADPETVVQNIASVCDLSIMNKGDNRMLRRFYGLDANDYASVTLYTPPTNMDAEEFLLIKLNDVSQTDYVVNAINTRLTTQMNTFDGYGVSQYKLLQDHVLDVRGNFILYLVHADAAKGDQAYINSL